MNNTDYLHLLIHECFHRSILLLRRPFYSKQTSVFTKAHSLFAKTKAMKLFLILVNSEMYSCN